MPDMRTQSMRDEIYTSPTAPFEFTADADHTLDALMAARFATTSSTLAANASKRASICEFRDAEVDNADLAPINAGPYSREIIADTSGTVYVDTPWETNVPCKLLAGVGCPIPVCKLYKSGTTLTSVLIYI